MRLVLALTLLLAGCAKGSSTTPQDDAGPQPTPDAAVVTSGNTGTKLVPGAIKASSPKYKLIGTLTVGDGRTASEQHIKNGGVVGGTQP